VVRARGDRQDVLGAGLTCPEGASFGALDSDPDRLTGPLVRRGGRLTQVGWAEAFAALAAGLGPLISEHGGACVAVYHGNPNVHTLAGGLYPPLLVRALGTRNIFAASTLDQMPEQVACGYLFGHAFTVPVPDLDRTERPGYGRPGPPPTAR